MIGPLWSMSTGCSGGSAPGREPERAPLFCGSAGLSGPELRVVVPTALKRRAILM